MSISIAPNPLPSGYGPEGLEALIRANHGCHSRWVQAYDVTVPEHGPGAQSWIGFVHEFELIDHPTSDRGFAVFYSGPEGARQTYTYLKDNLVRNAEIAARVMLDGMRPDRVSKS